MTITIMIYGFGTIVMALAFLLTVSSYGRGINLLDGIKAAIISLFWPLIILEYVIEKVRGIA